MIMLVFPGACFDTNLMLCVTASTTRSLVRLMIVLSLDVWELMIVTALILAHIDNMRELARRLAHRWMASSMGLLVQCL